MLEFIANIVASAKEQFANIQGNIESLFDRNKPHHGIYDRDGITNVFPNIGVLTVEVLREKVVASQPLENNKYQQDNIIDNPNTIVVTLAAESDQIESLYNTLDQLYASNNVLLSVLTDNRLYSNYVLQSLPIRRDPSKFDLLEIPVVLHEFVYRGARTSLMSDPANVELAEYSDRQKAGLSRPQTVSGADEIRIRAQQTVVPGGR